MIDVDGTEYPDYEVSLKAKTLKSLKLPSHVGDLVAASTKARKRDSDKPPLHGVLESLEGGPVEVHGRCKLSYNMVRNFVGSPIKKVHGEFDVSGNILTTLAGMPVCGGNIVVSSNPIRSLKGVQSRIHGNFTASMLQLTDLSDGPVAVEGAYTLSSSVKSIETLFVERVDMLDLAYSYDMTSVSGISRKVLQATTVCLPACLTEGFLEAMLIAGVSTIRCEWRERDVNAIMERHLPGRNIFRAKLELIQAGQKGLARM